MMELEGMKAIFVLADLEVLKQWELVDGYDKERGWPWWLVKTKWGLIEIGWRKRVIALDWSDTGIKASVTTDNVTKCDYSVHAWSSINAVECLTKLKKELVLGVKNTEEE